VRETSRAKAVEGVRPIKNDREVPSTEPAAPLLLQR